jgi:hypothetical protein
MEVKNSYMEMLEQPAEQLRMRLAPFTGTVPSTSGTYGFYNEANGTWVLFGNDRFNGQSGALRVSVYQRVDNTTPVGCGDEARTIGQELFTDPDLAFQHILNLLAQYHPDMWKLAFGRMRQYASMAVDIHSCFNEADSGFISNARWKDAEKVVEDLRAMLKGFGHLDRHKGYYPTIPVPLQVEAHKSA